MAHLSLKHRSTFRNSFSPSRRHSRHTGPRFLATSVYPSWCSDTAPLRGTASVMRNGGDILDGSNAESGRLERANCRLASAARALDVNDDAAHPHFRRL